MIINERPPCRINLPDVKKELKLYFETLRSTSSNHQLMVAIGNSLNHSISVIQSEGVQRDTLSRISSGQFSLSKIWFEDSEQDSDVVIHNSKESLNKKVEAQLNAVFGNHHPTGYYIRLDRCSEEEYILWCDICLKNDESILSEIIGGDFSNATTKIYTAHLKSRTIKHLDDWEKAVHELSTPLDTIFSDGQFIKIILDRPDLDPAYKKQKVNDLIDVSTLLLHRLRTYKYAFGKPGIGKVEKKRIDLYKLIIKYTHIFYHELSAKRGRFNYDGVRDIFVNTDENVLSYILFNVISNAVKYCSKHTDIIISAKQTAKSIDISISNIGIPVSDEDSLRVFDFEFRSETAKQYEARGSGIGLFVCKNMCKEIGARIRISEFGSPKTTFEVSIREEI